MRRIAAFLCAFTLASATVASAAPMPWKLFNEPAMLQAGGFAHIVACPLQNGEVFMAGFSYGKDAKYIMTYEPVSGLIAFAYAPKDDVITEIGFGHVDLKTPGQRNVIPPLYWTTFSMALHNNACDLMFKASA